MVPDEILVQMIRDAIKSQGDFDLYFENKIKYKNSDTFTEISNVLGHLNIIIPQNVNITPAHIKDLLTIFRATEFAKFKDNVRALNAQGGEHEGITKVETGENKGMSAVTNMDTYLNAIKLAVNHGSALKRKPSF